MTPPRWVLLPGTLCTPQVFSPLLECLNVAPEQRHFIVPNLPTVGEYTAPLREAVSGGEVVCGFSLGALIIAHNLKAIKRARAVVLLASNPFPDPPGNRANREATRDAVLSGGARDWVDRNWSAMSVAQRGDLRDVVASMAEECVPLIRAQTELAASRPGAVDQIRDARLPVHFVTGSMDRLTPADALRPVVQSTRTATLDVLDGLGHFALMEAPERVATALSNHL